MKKNNTYKHHPYTTPCIWITPQAPYFPLLGGSGDLKTTINPEEHAEGDGRANGWSGFDQDDQVTGANLWDDK